MKRNVSCTSHELRLQFTCKADQERAVLHIRHFNVTCDTSAIDDYLVFVYGELRRLIAVAMSLSTIGIIAYVEEVFHNEA